MRLSRRLIPAALTLVALSLPVVAFAQGMMPDAYGLATRENATHGTILTNTEGRTVYTWRGDTQGNGMSNCYDACANAWPPVLLSNDAAMMMMSMPGMSMESMSMMMEGFGMIQRTDGSYQVTFNGWPLYYFVRDTAPGEVNGHGSTGFNGLWEVVPAGSMMTMEHGM